MLSRGLKPKPYPRDYSIGWSFSALNMFQNCQRQYYFDRVSPRWISYPEGKLRELRAIRSLPILIGDAVHKTIADYFQTFLVGNEMRDEDLYSSGEEIFQQVLKTSITEERQRLEKEAYKAKVEEATKKVSDMLHAFYGLKLRSDVEASLPLNPEKSFIDPSGVTQFYGEFRIGDFKGYAPPDLIYLKKNRHHEVISWKTGLHNVDGFLMQLAGQILFCIHSFDLPPEELTGRVINLNSLEGQPVELQGASSILERCLERMRREVAELVAKFDNPQMRVPKAMEEFSLAPTQNTCTMCKFKSICEGPQ